MTTTAVRRRIRLATAVLLLGVFVLGLPTAAKARTSLNLTAEGLNLTAEGDYCGFYDFPDAFFDESAVPVVQVLKAVDAQYLSL
jgi:hypothetical protein